jgi:putative transposase
LSATQLAGEPHRGRRGGAIIWHGSQQGQVSLAERKVRVQRARLRRRGGGIGAEVAIPAYEALKHNDRTGAWILEILLCGVSTRNYAKVLPEMAESVGSRAQPSAASSWRRAKRNSKSWASGGSTSSKS